MEDNSCSSLPHPCPLPGLAEAHGMFYTLLWGLLELSLLQSTAGKNCLQNKLLHPAVGWF